MPWTTGEPIRIIVPGPPKALERNRHRIVTTRDKRQFVANYLPAQSAKEQSSIRKIAYDVMAGRAPLDQLLELKFLAYMPIPASWSQRKQAAAAADQIRPGGRPDLSNLVKQCEDAMNQVVYRDDSLIVDCHLWKRYALTPRLVVEIRALTWTA